jgi:ABC-type uncharacterized transport system permease subunit
MNPVTLIELTLLFGTTIGLYLLAFLLPKKGRKFVWGIAGLLLIIGITFYSTRPFIIQHRTNEAIDELNKHFTEIYPDDAWRITDKDVFKIRPIVYLNVIFESEPTVVYEYGVKNTDIEQVHMFMVSGDSVEKSGIEPQHDEGGTRGITEEFY